MLTKTMIVLASVLALGAAPAALAQKSEDSGGHRESGYPGSFATQGLNPIYHADSAAKCKKAYPKSYDPSSMTFLGKDGQRHPCP